MKRAPLRLDGGHFCSGETDHNLHGQAVTYCFEADDGTLWVSNDEYGSQVNFCPYCGFPMREEMERIIDLSDLEMRDGDGAREIAHRAIVRKTDP